MKRFTYFLTVLLPPLVLHWGIFFYFAQFDPCIGNPGCMAGSASLYFQYFISIPTSIVVFISAAVQGLLLKEKYRKHLLINFVLAVLPFLLVRAFFAVGALIFR